MKLIDERQLLLQQYDLKRFIFETYPNFIYAPFLQQTIELLQKTMFQIRAGKMPRINLCYPPRFGKTSITAQRFLLWCLLNNPEWEVTVTSYSQTIAEKSSLAARNLLENDPYIKKIFPNITLSKERSSVKEWFIYNKGKLAGCYRAVGVGGSLTGSGYNCFVADTKILCYDGYRKISDIKPNELVLSYNHVTKKPEWMRVVATKVSKINEETITLRMGKKSITCTSDHRIFCGDSYKPASSIIAGEYGISVNSSHEMLLLLKNIYKKTARGIKAGSRKSTGLLLLKRLFRKASRCKKQTVMYLVRKRKNSNKDKKILRYLQEKYEHKTPSTYSMRFLQKCVSTKKPHYTFLLKRMSKCFSFKENERQGKLELQRRKRKNNIIFQNKGAYKRARRWALRIMSRGERSKEVNCSSYRRDKGKQSSFKFSDFVQQMSYHSPQVGSKSFSSVSRNCKKEQFVYDLQIEGNNNFFAEGILVHNCLICDDLFKGAEDSDSQLIRDKVWDWYTSVALTRQAPLNCVININTRWHLDDHIGRLLKIEPDAWRTIKYKAIKDDGTSLFPQRFTTNQLLKIQGTMPPRLWSALYEQNPIQAGGNMIKEQHIISFKEADMPGQFDMMLQSWDLRFSRSQSKSSSFVVGQVWGKCNNKYYLLDQFRERVGFVESKSAIQAMSKKWPKATLKLVEKKANGEALEDDLQWLGITLVEPRGDKVQRVERCYGSLASGQVLIHESLIDTIKPELLAFPNGDHDDQCDSLSQALNWFQDNQFQGVFVL